MHHILAYLISWFAASVAVAINLFAAWVNWRSGKATILSGRVFTMDMEQEIRKKLNMAVVVMKRMSLEGHQPPDVIHFDPNPTLEYFHKLPSKNHMVFSIKPIKLTSYFTLEEIIELTGTIPEE